MKRSGNTSGDRSFIFPELGFLLTDATLRPLSANQEAITALAYPAKQKPLPSLVEAFDEKIRRSLLRVHGFPSTPETVPPVIQLKSGRRVYFCQAFRLDSNVNEPDQAKVLIVLERGISESLALSQVSQQFHLTQREQVALTCHLHGLSSGEIADRMRISPNTVKAFLRKVMVKMGVCTRSGIASKVLGLVLSPSGRSGLRQNPQDSASIGVVDVHK